MGVYQAAAQVPLLFSVVLGAFNSMFAPMLVNLRHAGSHERIEELFRVSTKWTVYLCLPAFLVICFVPTSLMKFVVFGRQYASGAIALPILSVGQMVNAATGPVGLLMMMTGHQDRWA